MLKNSLNYDYNEKHTNPDRTFFPGIRRHDFVPKSRTGGERKGTGLCYTVIGRLEKSWWRSRLGEEATSTSALILNG